MSDSVFLKCFFDIISFSLLSYIVFCWFRCLFLTLVVIELNLHCVTLLIAYLILHA